MSVFEEVRQTLEPTVGPAHRVLIRLLTVDGKIPYRLAMRRLLIRERSLVNELMGRDEIRMVAPGDEAYATCNVLVSYSPMGKVSLYIGGTDTPPEDADIIAGLAVEAAIMDRVREEAKQEALLEQRERRQIDEVLHAWEAQGERVARVREVADWVDHVETVYLHVDRKVFARSDVGNNLLRGRYLEQLEAAPVSQWLPEDRVFVFAIHALFRTGRSIRFEEFNGLELSARELRRWLSEKLCLYHEALGREAPTEALQLPMLALATRVGEMLAEVDRSGCVRIRRINGITITKEEMLIAPEDAAGRDLTRLPALLVDYAARELELELDGAASAERNMEACTLAALHRDMAAGTPTHLEEIVQCIVLSATMEADADYAMSSSLRSFARLQGTQESRAAGALSLSKPDFFTCVLNHPVRTKDVSDADMGKILHAVAARMEFNRWHFVVGNFERHEIPQNRHYYFPPTMPDIAEWSDVWHGGHVNAAVRYTIRTPGAPLWKDPLMAFGHPCRGLYDIRLVRMHGPGFTKKELFSASRHSTLIDVFWRTVMKQIHDGLPVPAIEGFTKDWYLTTMKWKEVLAECSEWETSNK
jgi:hypothetical protein